MPEIFKSRYDLIKCENCSRKHFRFMNCKASRVLRLINYLPIIGSYKNIIDLIVQICKGESDDIVEAGLITTSGLLVDYFTFGTTTAAFQGMFKSGEAFKVCSQLAGKITTKMSGNALEKLADEMFEQAIKKVLIICEEIGAKECIEKVSGLVVINAKECAINATVYAAQNLACITSLKYFSTKAFIAYGLSSLANGTNDMIEFSRKLLSYFNII